MNLALLAYVLMPTAFAAPLVELPGWGNESIGYDTSRIGFACGIRYEMKLLGDGSKNYFQLNLTHERPKGTAIKSDEIIFTFSNGTVGKPARTVSPVEGIELPPREMLGRLFPFESKSDFGTSDSLQIVVPILDDHGIQGCQLEETFRRGAIDPAAHRVVSRFEFAIDGGYLLGRSAPLILANNPPVALGLSFYYYPKTLHGMTLGLEAEADGGYYFLGYSRRWLFERFTVHYDAGPALYSLQPYGPMSGALFHRVFADYRLFNTRVTLGLGVANAWTWVGGASATLGALARLKVFL